MNSSEMAIPHESEGKIESRELQMTATPLRVKTGQDPTDLAAIA